MKIKPPTTFCIPKQSRRIRFGARFSRAGSLSLLLLSACGGDPQSAPTTLDAVPSSTVPATGATTASATASATVPAPPSTGVQPPASTAPPTTGATIAPAVTTVDPSTTSSAATTETAPATEPVTTSDPATTEPATTEPVTTSDPATTGPVTTEPVTTSDPATTEPATTEPVTTSEPATTEPATTTTDTTPAPVVSDCGVSPVNPNASQQARNLLCYLYEVYGEKVLSGQQETSWNANPADDVNWINQQTGKYPAILGGDYLYPDGTTTRAKQWWDAGGITMIRYHMGAPPKTDTYENSKSTTNVANVLKSGTQENTSFLSKLDYVAKELQILEDANVPVLWAPFHEVQPNGWFWWCSKNTDGSAVTSAQFIQLWKYMYDYLTNTKGLDNLIWLMPFSGTPNAAWYPGKDFVDISGPDTYDKGQPFSAMYNSAKNIIGSTVPIPLHETGVIPDPNAMFPSSAPWLLFNIWAGYERDTSQNSVDKIKSTYAHDRTITRDEVPNLK